MTSSSRARAHLTCSTTPDRPARRPVRASDDLSDAGVQIVATRLRVIGHPLRLRIMRALDGSQGTVEELAEHLGVDSRRVAAHVSLLYRGGILARVDSGGPPSYVLADWPSMWLVDQLARRLTTRAACLAETGCELDEQDRGSACE